MSAFDPRTETARAVRAGFAVSLSIIAALSAGGCANSGTAYSADPPGARIAEGPPVPMESDGLPVQAAPSSQSRQLPDDPSQPFSPNYGGANPASTRPTAPTVKAANEPRPAGPAIPSDLPAAFRKQLLAAREAAG